MRLSPTRPTEERWGYLARKTLCTLFMLGLPAAHPSAVAAEVARYIDETGKATYVDSPEKVPERYRNQLGEQRPLPGISRSASGGRVLYEKERYSSSQPVAAAPANRVEIFVTSWCPYCRKLEQLLNEHQISFVRYDIEKSAKGRRIYDSLGGSGIPVSRIGAQVVEGFQPEMILRAARRAE